MNASEKTMRRNENSGISSRLSRAGFTIPDYGRRVSVAFGGSSREQEVGGPQPPLMPKRGRTKRTRPIQAPSATTAVRTGPQSIYASLPAAA